MLPLAAVLAVSACSSQGTDGSGKRRATGRQGASAGGASASPSASAAPSSGCSRRGVRDGRYSFGGRSYLLAVPSRRPGVPAPLIVDLHGLRSNAFQQALYGRLAGTGPPRGYLVVEPEGLRGRTGWKLPGMSRGGDDVAYVGALLDHLERTLCVDRRREYAAGFSNGAGLSAALVCGLRGRLAGVAPVAGLNLARPCRNARPTTIVAFHGTADPIIPFGGGEPFGGNQRRVPGWMRPLDGVFRLPAVAPLAARWARTFGCGAAVRDVPATGVGHLTYPRCRNGARVELYTVTGGGHTWPGSIPIGTGRTTHRVDATELILDTFSKAERL